MAEDLCPDCKRRGRKVKPRTIESLVGAAHRDMLTSTDSFRFCASPGCVVAYYAAAGSERPADTIPAKAVRVRIGVKEPDDPRPICYCFGFTSSDIERQVRDSGRCASVDGMEGCRGRGTCPNIADEIKAKCKEGLDRCEIENPRGACCLVDVQRIAKAAGAAEQPGAPCNPCCED